MDRIFVAALALSLAWFGMITAAKADVVYSLQASETVVGSFSWSVSAPTFITTSTQFSTFTSLVPPTGCTISGAGIETPLGLDPFIETFFALPCNPLGLPDVGLGFVEVSQTFFSAGPLNSLGIYHPDGLLSPIWTLTVTSTSPVATPEPPTVFLLVTFALLCVCAWLTRETKRRWALTR
jgi:hypothetical protein